MPDVFAPVDAGTVSLSASNSTGRVALPARDGRRTLRIYNAGSVDVFVRFGDVTVTAATTDMPIKAGDTVLVSVTNAATGVPEYMAGITASSTATVYVTMGDMR